VSGRIVPISSSAILFSVWLFLSLPDAAMSIVPFSWLSAFKVEYKTFSMCDLPNPFSPTITFKPEENFHSPAGTLVKFESEALFSILGNFELPCAYVNHASAGCKRYMSETLRIGRMPILHRGSTL
jgi:hypothetical protein